MEFRKEIMKGFARGIMRKSTQPQGLIHWLENGAVMPSHYAPGRVIARHGRKIYHYTPEFSRVYEIPDVVWRVWPRSVLGNRL